MTRSEQANPDGLATDSEFRQGGASQSRSGTKTANAACDHAAADCTPATSDITSESKKNSAYSKTYAAGIRALSRRDHGETELRRKLQRKFTDEPEATEAALSALKQQNFLSDERFVAGVIRGRISRGYGPYYIRRELLSKGVAGPLVDQHLKALEQNDDVDWFAVAGQLVERRFAERSSEPKEWMKAVRFLQRRGFSADVVQETVGPQPREDIAG